MRIRTIKPEFWSDDKIAGLKAMKSYDGRILRPCDFDRVTPPKILVRYVYFIFSNSDLRYVGQTWHIRDRIEKHRFKQWFCGCNHIEILSVSGKDEFDLQSKSNILEKRSIEELLPSGNISGPDYLPGRMKWKEMFQS